MKEREVAYFAKECNLIACFCKLVTALTDFMFFLFEIMILLFDLAGLEFNNPVNTNKIMLSLSVFLNTFFLGGLSPLRH